MTETPEDRPATGIRAWFRRRLDSPLKQAGAALGAAVVVGAVAGTAWLALTGDDGGGQAAFVGPPGFALSPEGDDVPRLTPIRVTFASAPGERSGEKLLALEPAVPGSYAWLSDRTLVFQPDFPGLLRGSAYSVTVPPRPETGLTEDVRRQFRVTGLLEVQQVIPGDGDSEVPLTAPVLVQFSRSVAPLTTLAARAGGPELEFDPPLEGTGEWLNTSVYRFVPERLEPFTTYTIRLPKGLTSAADGVLQADFGWSFTTVRPSVAAVVPDANTQFASPTQAVTVTFNQPIGPLRRQRHPAGRAGWPRQRFRLVGHHRHRCHIHSVGPPRLPDHVHHHHRRRAAWRERWRNRCRTHRCVHHGWRARCRPHHALRW